MATRKPATTKKTPAKTTAAKAKSKTPAKKTTNKSKKTPPPQSFRLSQETERFISSRITTQTIYWLVLGAFILGASLLILKSQLEILDTLNQITQNSY